MNPALLRLPTFLALCGLISSLASPRVDAELPDESRWSTAEIDFFESKIRPVLLDRCVECHSEDGAESGLSVESRSRLLRGGDLGPAVVPGHPEQSLLISAINHGEFIKMPPKDKLATTEVLDFTKWVKMGAPWPDDAEAIEPTPQPLVEDGDAYTPAQRAFWSLQPLADPIPPQVSRSDWVRSPIDRFVLAKLADAGLEPARAATKVEWIRRATYDLTGLPPHRAEIDRFLADESPAAFERVIDRLLASPRYGEHWGRHWLDVARYADSNGLDENLAYAHAYRYRDYVIAAWNADKPYDRFITEQVAGDLLFAHEGKTRDDLQLYVATGFLAIGAKMLAEDDPVKMQMDIIDEQLHTLGQAVLGLTLGCARCHDHKFDPIPMRDYYSLAGIFKSTKTMNHHRVVAEWYERPLTDPDAAQQIDQLNQEIGEAKAAVDRLRDQARQRVATQSRRQLGNYLRAALALERFDQRMDQPAHSTVASGERFPVHDGFVVIEAEAFQRGDVERLDDGYGEGIGVIASRGAGFVEYDLEVERAGSYDLELRYAAEQSRPFQVSVNGKPAASDVGGQVTGNWYPAGQSWFAAARIDLQAGPNVVRFTSDAVYPHVDKFALIFASEKDWPFDTSPPQSLSRIAADYAVSAAFARRWHRFLHRVAEGKVRGQGLFLPWSRLLQTTPSTEADTLRELITQPDSKDVVLSGLRQVLGKSPVTVNDFADLYQRLADDVFAETADDARQSSLPWRKLREIAQREFNAKTSPLSGPMKNLDEFLQQGERREISDLNQKIVKLEAAKPKPPVAMGVTEAEPEDLQIHLRGSHLALGSTAPRGFLSALPNHHELSTSQSGRLELAQWLTCQPLTYRVIVNRLWHWHFGNGIVSSVDNFGALGELPSHPMLLDWLAGQLMRSRGSLKALHREIMLSSTYRMSTEHDPHAAAVDPDNRLLWRMNRRRLTAEEVRDTILAHGAGLDFRMGGSLLKVANRAYVTSSGTNVTDEYRHRRRTIYLPVVRSSVYDVLQTLDFPDPAVSVGKRQVSTVAPQALMLMNSDLVDEETAWCADRICGNATADINRIHCAYRILLGRNATSVEVSRARSFLRATQGMADERQRWRSLVRVLMSTNEYAYIE